MWWLWPCIVRTLTRLILLMIMVILGLLGAFVCAKLVHLVFHKEVGWILRYTILFIRLIWVYCWLFDVYSRLLLKLTAFVINAFTFLHHTYHILLLYRFQEKKAIEVNKETEILVKEEEERNRCEFLNSFGCLLLEIYLL